MFWEDPGSGSDYGSECGTELEELERLEKVREASRALPPGWAAKRVLNYTCHRKKCSYCGCGWYNGDWYFTDVSYPWGAEKLCLDCIDAWLIQNGVSDSLSEGEDEDEFSEEEEDEEFGAQGAVSGEPQVQGDNQAVVKTEQQDIKAEPKIENREIKCEEKEVKFENIEVKLEAQDYKAEIKQEISVKNEAEVNYQVSTQFLGKREIVKQEQGVEREEDNQPMLKRIKTEQ